MPSMISPFVTSLVYSKKRRTVMGLIPPTLRKIWNDWDLRVLVLLSLILQVVLIILGNRRKYIHRLWIRIVVWLAYLASDYVATCALGMLSSNLADLYDENARSLDANIELTALWAPFLLLHLGGPDTITAYALEDNELWLRHLLGLVSQTVTAVYVFHMAWTGSYLSILFILMFLVGLIKYVERTWALRSVSSKKLEKSMHDYLDFSRPGTDPLHLERIIRMGEGYLVEAESFPESCLGVDFSLSSDNSISTEDSLRIAFAFLDLSKCFFLDAILNSNEKDTTLSVFRNISFESAFKVVEIELGFAYDLFYTKAPLLYTPWGLVLRLVTFFLTCSVLMLFTFLYNKHKYSKVDISITLVLLIVAIILEMYAALVLVFSDRFAVWLSVHNRISTFQILNSFPLFKSPRWSNIMPQYSFIRSCFSKKNEPLPSCNAPSLFNLDKMLEKSKYVVYKEVPKESKELIFCYIRSKARGDHQDPTITRGAYRDDIGECPDFGEELGKSILFWHIVTELLYGIDREEILKQSDNAFVKRCQSTKRISRYMFYLLVENPSMLSTGNNRFEATVTETVQILGGRTIKEACEGLIEWHKFEHRYQEHDRSQLSLLPEAVCCADKLMTKFPEEKWGKIYEGWLEILTYAANKCNRNQHAQQLRNGGEFLTHVWLLMAHFGLTDHFQITKEPRLQLTRLIAK